MYINFKSVSITPNPAETEEKLIISVDVELSTWARLKAFMWSVVKRFTWKNVREDNLDEK